jgi:hypothetical protein
MGAHAMAADNHARPWYRERWVWIILAAPAAAVVMGVVMVVLAVRSNDGLVADDYYKQGLAINQVIDRQERAKSLGIAAVVQFSPDRARVRVKLSGTPASTATVRLILVHPTRAGSDQVVELDPQPGGELGGMLAPVAQGRWRIILEDRTAGWRVSGAWQSGESTIALGEARQEGTR